jgi:excisionase family DNA binding protein
MMTSLQDMLTTAQVAAKLGVSRWTIYNWARARRIPYTRVGAALLFDPAELQQWLRQHTVQPQAAVPEGRG